MNWGRLYFGGLVVAVGVVLLLDNAGTLDAGEFFSTWWPVALILAGLVSLLANPRSWVAPLILTIVGVALLLRTLDIIDTFELIFPAILILIGIFVIFGRSRPGSEVSDADSIKTFNVFSGTEIASHSSAFKGGQVSVVFGGAEVDLRDATLAPGALIDVFAAFGGVEIKVPDGWQVVTKGFPIFGGFDNETAKERVAPDAPTLQVHATVLFGGIDVKH